MSTFRGTKKKIHIPITVASMNKKTVNMGIQCFLIPSLTDFIENPGNGGNEGSLNGDFLAPLEAVVNDGMVMGVKLLGVFLLACWSR
jgi:hypothetical protein